MESVKTLARQMSMDGIAYYSQWEAREKEVRDLLGRLIGAEARDVAFISNTSEGLSIIATGFAWRAGEKVLSIQPDFPSNIYPWMNLERVGVEVVVVKRREGRFSIKDVATALKPGVKMITVSSVDFASGHYCDLEGLGELCKEKGLILCVDGIQSIGVIPVDVKKYGIHVLAAGGQKWLLGPMGCGLLFVSHEVRDLIHPTHVGWKSVIDEEEFFDLRFELKRDCARFEPGTLNLFGIYALGAAVELLLEVGVDQIRDKVLATNDLFIQGLKSRGLKIASPLDREERSGILYFIPPGDATRCYLHLQKHNVMVSERNGKIRLSPHFYNNEDDVTHFFQALDSYLSLS